MIIGRLSESMPADTRRLILYPLLRPLLLFWGPRGRQQPSSSSRPSPSTSSSPSSSLSSLSGKASPPCTSKKAIQMRKPSSNPPPTTAAAAEAAAGAGAAAPGAAARGKADNGGDGRGDGSGGGGGGGIGRDDVVSSEERLDRCLEDLEKLLTAAPAPAALLGLLSRMGVAVPLFRLHCFCTT